MMATRLVVTAGLFWSITACDRAAPPDERAAPPDERAAPELEDAATPEGRIDGAGVSQEAGAPGRYTRICEGLKRYCEPTPSVTKPTLGEPLIIAPSSALPPAVMSQPSHNNLDVNWFQGRLFLAFRTAPDHFASAETRLYVVSTPDLGEWRFEGAFHLSTDLREPQLIVAGDTLHFNFAVLGTNPFAFEPQGVKRTTYRGPKQWTELEDAFPSSFIPWRVNPVGDRLYLTGYVGGENIYDFGGDPIRVHWLKSDDGVSWSPVVDGQPVVLEGGSSETDFTFTDSGSVVAVSRNEAGDETGFGMKICRAPALDLGSWTCVFDPKKYDSPLLFNHKGTIYLIGRRNVTDSGNYDLGADKLPLEEQALKYQADYWTHPKRCALWTLSEDTLEVTHALDLPSKGDTCFPELLQLTDTRYLVFNYSSPWEGSDDPSWLEGQTAPTVIYAITLDLP